jgi:hypothetical protein
MSDVDLPVGHVREQIAHTIDLVVHLARFPDGRRAVARIASVEGMEDERVLLRDVFEMSPHTDQGAFGVRAAKGDRRPMARGNGRQPALIRGS